jgi:hypothetical protein
VRYDKQRKRALNFSREVWEQIIEANKIKDEELRLRTINDIRNSYVATQKLEHPDLFPEAKELQKVLFNNLIDCSTGLKLGKNILNQSKKEMKG